MNGKSQGREYELTSFSPSYIKACMVKIYLELKNRIKIFYTFWAKVVIIWKSDDYHFGLKPMYVSIG